MVIAVVLDKAEACRGREALSLISKAPSTCIPIFLNPLSRVAKYESSTNPITSRWENMVIFESDDVANSCPVPYRTINQNRGTTKQICRHYRAPYSVFSEHILLERSPGYLSESGYHGCVWTGEFNLNTLRVDAEIFESGKKKLRIQKYPDTCRQSLNQPANLEIKTTSCLI